MQLMKHIMLCNSEKTFIKRYRFKGCIEMRKHTHVLVHFKFSITKLLSWTQLINNLQNKHVFRFSPKTANQKLLQPLTQSISNYLIMKDNLQKLLYLLNNHTMTLLQSSCTKSKIFPNFKVVRILCGKKPPVVNHSL